jgi:hypothetical protein
MVTYYRDDTVHITAEAIQVCDRRYPLDQLSYVWHRRTARLRRGGYMLLSRGGLIAVMILLLVGVGFAARRVNLHDTDPMVLAGGILAVIVVAAAAAFALEGVLNMIDRTYEHGRGVHEIWARIGTQDVELFRTTDALIFGKVYRSLQRAIEQSD